jgi:hypothetical protein
MADVVVVSSSPDGDVVAGAIASTGRSVLHLVVDPPGDPAPEVPTGRGLLSVGADDPLATAVFGPLVPFVPERALLAGGAVHPLPLRGDTLLGLFAFGDRPRVATALARARGASGLAALIGGGQEQRSYRDWVVSRFGEPVYDRLYAPYAARRFGPPEDVLAAVARVHHGPVAPNALVAPAEGWAAVRARLGARVERGVVRELRRVASDVVETEAGTFSGHVWADIAPPRLLPVLAGEPRDMLGHHVGRMTFRHGIEVILRGGRSLPFETHVVDGDVPVFRLVRPGLLPSGGAEDILVAQLAVDPEDRRWTGPDAALVAEVVAALGAVGDIDAAGARVRRLPWHHPVWSTGHLVRLRHWLLHRESVGVTPFGRAGLTSPVDLGTSVRWVSGRLGADPVDLRELGRQLLEPPVLDPPERPHLRDFIVA